MKRPAALIAVLSIAALVAPAQAGHDPTHRQQFGAVSHATWGGTSLDTMRRELDLLASTGATVVRAEINWSSLETNGKGQWSQWYLDHIDRFTAEAAARNIKVVAVTWGTPCWASTAPSTVKQNCSGSWWDRGVTRYPPTSASHYGDAVDFIVRRWGSRLAALEVWNEPNLDRFLVAPDQAAAYTPLLREAYGRAKGAMPSLNVLGVSTAFADADFIRRVYDHGGAPYMDALAIHPYNEWRDPDDRWQAQWRKYTLVPGVEWVRDTQALYGQSHVAIWITELGWPSCPRSSGKWCVGETDQATYIADAFRIMKGWAFLDAGLIYQLRDAGTSLTDMEHSFGLVRRDFSQKPSWARFQEAVPPTAPACVP